MTAPLHPPPPWPWLGNAQATAARRATLWHLLGTAPVDAGMAAGRLLRTDAEGTEFAIHLPKGTAETAG